MARRQQSLGHLYDAEQLQWRNAFNDQGRHGEMQRNEVCHVSGGTIKEHSAGICMLHTSGGLIAHDVHVSCTYELLVMNTTHLTRAC